MGNENEPRVPAGSPEGGQWTKQLEVGKDYAKIMGLSPERGQHMIFEGGNKWLMQQPGSERHAESAGTTQNALKYINQPSINMGPF